ncbi:dihydroorotase [Muriicola jejuensis]|uniref:Dihydroorotase n=1 Tax=Muriicola jejuensis TaxID=504488 RepID=A0A6P0UH96_9FLAO|nr:dihydroorotase [Muriicola jejuensis]NER11178.1 dihydroorotase [Muriicola jejuensis]SMP24163.1 dihydroorotase [Muriicola jejuensis]
MNILLKSARILDDQNKSLHGKVRDIWIKNGVIEKIATSVTPDSRTKVIELPNLHISPGWIDSSVSFGEPGYEERETLAHGARVAALSGFTDIILNPNTNPVPDTSGDIVFVKKTAAGKGAHVHPLGTLTRLSAGTDLAEMYDMQKAGAVAFYDFKSPVTHANLLKIALQYAQGFGGLVFSFPMDASIAATGTVNEGDTSTKLGLRGIPALAEEIQIARDLSILEYTGGKLHIPTISTARAVSLISEAKKKGLDVSCSVAIHNLFHTDEVLHEYDTHFKVMPPLRTAKDREALRKGVRNGVIDMVTSDHMPIDIEEKRVEFDRAAYGSLGLESFFVILNSIFGPELAVEILTRGRQRFSLESPVLKEGARAGLSLFNPEGEYFISKEGLLSTSKNSMYIGKKGKGRVYGSVTEHQVYLHKA